MLTPRTSWLFVVSSYAGVISMPLLVMLQLSSGYGGTFLGLWNPPNSEALRRNVGITLLILLIASTALSLFTARQSTGPPRNAAIFSFSLGMLFLAFFSITATFG
jgi:hypothetical protein